MMGMSCSPWVVVPACQRHPAAPRQAGPAHASALPGGRRGCRGAFAFDGLRDELQRFRGVTENLTSRHGPASGLDTARAAVRMLRSCLTWLWAMWLAQVLPLHQNVQFHQFMGCTVVRPSLTHGGPCCELRVQCRIDGPYGTPTPRIFAVCTGAGFSVTPSIPSCGASALIPPLPHRHQRTKHICPSCQHCQVEGVQDKDMKRHQAFQEVTTEKKGKAQVLFCGSSALAKVLKGHCEQFNFKIFQENFYPRLSKLCPDPHRQPA
ncbi:Nadph Oxidase 5 [Manis pentadactyla]|nr:Nadph Oxidase 5 [Manis pentadactyla]